MGQKTILVVAAALIAVDSRVLLAQRPAGKSMAGLWEFPGGKVAAGETPEAALVRELREELSIDVQPKCLAPFTFASHAYADFHLLVPLARQEGGHGLLRQAAGGQPAVSRPLRTRQAMAPATEGTARRKSGRRPWPASNRRYRRPCPMAGAIPACR